MKQDNLENLKQIQRKQSKENYKECLFTNVPLDETISIVLRKIYDEGKIETNIPRNLMK